MAIKVYSIIVHELSKLKSKHYELVISRHINCCIDSYCKLIIRSYTTKNLKNHYIKQIQ